MQQDTYRHKGLRKKLIQSLRKKGIRDERVLHAMEEIPRHCFLDKAFEEWAYRDVPFPIGNEQTISQPYTVAFQTELLQIQPKHKVLEIGTGSGYQACVLAEMGAKVYTLERVEPLFHKAHMLLIELGYRRIRCFLRDGYEGLPRFAPYDRILVTAGATEIPETLLDQLVVGGMMVIPVGQGDSQEMLRITKTGKHACQTENFGHFRFVPFLKGTTE
ncbi:MAG TPA: protein-L-isoaspartate(D-aspartate) O-methyltransferase [Saprospiraceae bacterium]|nr:protein-L-isoaspartate(D-aspartate) O-methyltransferase [Saprospiraceae bacterium]